MTRRFSVRRVISGELEQEEGNDGDGEVDDEDDDADEHEQYEAQDMLNEVTVKSGYLWKKGEKRKVSDRSSDSK